MLEYSYEEVTSVDCTIMHVIFEYKFVAEFGKPDITMLGYYSLFLQANALLKKNLENAKASLEVLVADLQFLRDQVTITQVLPWIYMYMRTHRLGMLKSRDVHSSRWIIIQRLQSIHEISYKATRCQTVSYSNFV